MGDSLVDFTGGVLGGIACVYVGQPLDTVKVKLQTFPGTYRNSVHCFSETLKTSGVYRGLYAGTTPNLVANVSEKSILFLAYGLCQKAVVRVSGKRDVSELSAIQKGFAGSAASFFSAQVLCPTELVKCKLQTMKELKFAGRLTGPLSQLKHIGPLTLIRHILRQEGILGLFHGLQATLAREMPGYFSCFTGYEACRTFLTPPGKSKDELSPWKLLLCGGVGGIFFWLPVFPMDVVKSRIQVHSGDPGFQKRSIIHLLVQISREEGFFALYNGFGPTVFRAFLASATLFVTYENTKFYLKKTFYTNPNS